MRIKRGGEGGDGSVKKGKERKKAAQRRGVRIPRRPAKSPAPAIHSSGDIDHQASVKRAKRFAWLRQIEPPRHDAESARKFSRAERTWCFSPVKFPLRADSLDVARLVARVSLGVVSFASFAVFPLICDQISPSRACKFLAIETPITPRGRLICEGESLADHLE